jgi:hypothetical protein
LVSGADCFLAASSLLLKTLEKKGIVGDREGMAEGESKALFIRSRTRDQLPDRREIYVQPAWDERDWKCVRAVAGRMNPVQRQLASAGQVSGVSSEGERPKGCWAGSNEIVICVIARHAGDLQANSIARPKNRAVEERRCAGRKLEVSGSSNRNR